MLDWSTVWVGGVWCDNSEPMVFALGWGKRRGLVCVMVGIGMSFGGILVVEFSGSVGS